MAYRDFYQYVLIRESNFHLQVLIFPVLHVLHSNYRCFSCSTLNFHVFFNLYIEFPSVFHVLHLNSKRFSCSTFKFQVFSSCSVQNPSVFSIFLGMHWHILVYIAIGNKLKNIQTQAYLQQQVYRTPLAIIK